MKSLRPIAAFIMCVFVVFSLSGFIPYGGSNDSVSYTMYVGDKPVGNLKFATRGLFLYDSEVERLKDSYPENVTIESEIYFKENRSSSLPMTPDASILTAIREAVDIKIDAYAIVIDGEQLFHVSSQSDAERVLDAVKDPHIKNIEDNNGQVEEVQFKEDVEILPNNIDYKDLISVNDAVLIITQGTEGIVEYMVEEGDSLWSIARGHDMRVSDIENSNPELNGETIKPGDIINITGEASLLSVITKEKTNYLEEIPFETEGKEDSSMYKGTTKVIQQGEKGEKSITAYITKEDGVEISREVIEEKVVKESVNKIEAKGTKARPVVQSSSPVYKGSARGADIVAEAKRHLGKPYVYATRGPNSFDCSGYTHYVYGRFGIYVSPGSRYQANYGKYVSKSELAPGDLILFSSPGSGGGIGHVGIYIGGGSFIHASGTPSRGGSVKISSLSSYSSRYISARRLI